MLSWGIISAPSWATNVSYPALTSVLSRSGTCGFFSSTCRSMFASGEVAYTPSRYTVFLSVLNLARHGSVTADRAQPTCPKSFFIVIDRLHSPAHSLATRGLSILALAMRMSPPPPGVFQCTPDPGRPDQVPWTLWRLYDRIHLIID